MSPSLAFPLGSAFDGDPLVIADLVQVYRGAVPADIASANRSLDEAWSLAAIFASAYRTIATWAQGIYIYSASGSQLDAQGTNEGVSRQGGETDLTYQARLRVPPDAGTPLAILTSLQQIVDAVGGGPVFLLQLPADGAYASRAFYDRYSIRQSGQLHPDFEDGGVRVISRQSSTLSRGKRLSGGRVRMVIVLIPASAGALTSCTDALRSKVSAGKAYLVQEYA